MVFLEIVVTKIPNSYSYKYNYVKTHGDKIQVLAIGHSQIYDGFDPSVFGHMAFNLGNSSQEFVDDYYILKELLDDIPNLKVVILPIGYSDVSLSDSKCEISERGTYYHEYMNIDYDGQLPFKYRFECINIPKAFCKIYDYYVRREDIVGCDSLGRRNKYKLEDRAWNLVDNKVISKYYNLTGTSDYVLRGEVYLNRIIDMLKERNIIPFLVSTPYYSDSKKDINQSQQSYIDKYIASFAREKEVFYVNYQYSPLFSDRDFYDEAHLSEYGACKFSKLLKKQIDSLP
jgi:hypothetical protein